MVKKTSKFGKRTTRFFIRATPNFGKRHLIGPEFKTRKQAQAIIKKILSKGKLNPGGVRRTDFRNTGAFGGMGLNNPRIIKRRFK